MPAPGSLNNHPTPPLEKSDIPLAALGVYV